MQACKVGLDMQLCHLEDMSLAEWDYFYKTLYGFPIKLRGYRCA